MKQTASGCSSCFSLLAIEPGVDLILEAGVERFRRKSIALSPYLIALVDAVLSPLGFELGSPRDADRRGSHVSIRHPAGCRISQALIEEMNEIPDLREPDSIHLGLAPLCTSFQDVWEAVDRIRRVVEGERHRVYSRARQAIT